MIGNDIVDLELAKFQSNWQRPNFLEKIFTLNERNYIQKAEYPDLEVWKLWSRKEAAYKIYNRETGIRGYFPWKLECSTLTNAPNKYNEIVKIENRIYYTETITTSDYIYTIAVKSVNELTQIREVSSLKKIIKINGLPFLSEGRKPVSITHHGRFERKIALFDS